MRGIAGDCGLEGVPVIYLEGQLASVIVAGGRAIHQRIERKETRAEHRLKIRVVPRRIEGAEEEEAIPQAVHRNVAAQLEVAFIVGVLEATAYLVGGRKLRVIGVLVSVLHPAAVEIPASRAEELRAARLGNELDDTAADVAVLRFETARLDLDFLHKREVDTGAERAIHTGPHTDSAEGRIVDGNAVCNIKILEARSAGNRRIFRARADARGYAWREVEEAANAAAQGNFGIEAVGEFGIH